MQNRGRTIAKHLQGSGSGRACYIHVMLAVARKVCRPSSGRSQPSLVEFRWRSRELSKGEALNCVRASLKNPKVNANITPEPNPLPRKVELYARM